MKAKRIGNQGYGLVVNTSFHKKVHELAHQFGIDRRVLLNTMAIDSGYCGERCLFCEELGLTAGLRSVVREVRPPRSSPEILSTRGADVHNGGDVHKQQGVSNLAMEDSLSAEECGG